MVGPYADLVVWKSVSLMIEGIVKVYEVDIGSRTVMPYCRQLEHHPSLAEVVLAGCSALDDAGRRMVVIQSVVVVRSLECKSVEAYYGHFD